MSLLAAMLSAALIQQPPPGCEDYETHRQFDFWVGEWNVYGRSGQFGGVNKITKTSEDCLLLEQWTSAGGGDGTSMNFVDPNTGQWRQIWMGVNNHIDYSGGLNDQGQMALEGEITYFGEEGGQSAPFRGTWTPNDDGTITQHFEQMNEDGEWTDWFVGTYKRAEDDPNEAAEALREAG